MDIEAPFHTDRQLIEDLLIDATQLASRLVDRFGDEIRAKLAEAIAGGGVLSLRVELSQMPHVSLHIGHPNGTTAELLRIE